MYNVDSFTKFYMIVKLQQTFAFRLAETLARVLKMIYNLLYARTVLFLVPKSCWHPFCP